MRIKKIAAVCKNRGQARLLDYTDSDGVVHQWISTGVSAYPVEKLPFLTEQQMAAVLDIEEKQLQKMMIGHDDAPGSIDFTDTADNETMAQELPFSAVFGGKVYLVYIVKGETVFIDFELMMPIAAEYKDVTLWRRQTEDGITYYAAKAGLLCVGLIWAMEHMDDLAEYLETAGGSYRA